MDAHARDETLSKAAKELRRGNLVIADMLAQAALRADPENPFAHNLVGIVATKLGLRTEAVASFERALGSLPSNEAVRDNLMRAKSLPGMQPAEEQRFLLIKAWGFGFWADVNHVLGCLLLAEITGRSPVIHWGSNSRFSDGSDADAFCSFFEPVSSISLERIKQVDQRSVFPPRWVPATLAQDDHSKLQERGLGAIQFLGRHETLAVSDFYIGVFDLVPWIPRVHALHGRSLDEIYQYLAKTYLRPVQSVSDNVARFHQTRIFGKTTMAVHVRGSDKATEFMQLDAFNTRYFSCLDTAPSETIFYLMTEDSRILEAFQSRYGDRIVATQSQRTTNDTGPHHLPGMDPQRLGREVLADTYIALQCDRFLGNGRSNVSATIELMKPWGEKARLLAPSQLREPNLYLYGAA